MAYKPSTFPQWTFPGRYSTALSSSELELKQEVENFQLWWRDNVATAPIAYELAAEIVGRIKRGDFKP